MSISKRKSAESTNTDRVADNDYMKFVELVDEMREAQKELEMHTKNDYEEYLDLWSDVETLESKVDKMLQTLKRNNNE